MLIDSAKLKSFVERIERLDEDAQALGDDRKEVYDEAKAAQFDVPALKAVISTRRKQRKNPSAFEAQSELIDAYLHALGTPIATRARAREDDDLTIPPMLRRV